MQDLYQTVANLQTEKRYKHTLGVVETAMSMGSMYEVDVKKCEIAGLLHDITKQMDSDQQQPYLNQIDDEFILDSTPLWHGYTGALYAQQQLNIDDQEILDAIKFHTIGTVNASKLGKIIYIADYLEPNRNLPGLDQLRGKIGLLNLDKLYNIVAKTIIEYEVSCGHKLHPLTKELYESII